MKKITGKLIKIKEIIQIINVPVLNLPRGNPPLFRIVLLNGKQ